MKFSVIGFKLKIWGLDFVSTLE